MSDTRFDGRNIYKFASASQAIYEILGKYIHRANSASQPKYEIRWNYIHNAHSASQPEFKILGTRIHKVHSAMREEFERGFVGMTVDPITVESLEAARDELIERIAAGFTNDDKRFLLSFKRGNLDWPLLTLPGVDQLPAVNWKQMKIAKLDDGRRETLIAALTAALGYPDQV